MGGAFGGLLGELDTTGEGTTGALVDRLACRGELAALEDTHNHSVNLLVTCRPPRHSGE